MRGASQYTYADEAAIEAVVTELAMRGWTTVQGEEPPHHTDLSISWPYTDKRLKVTVNGSPRFGRSGQPEWRIGVWKFQCRARRGLGIPFFRHPHYPGFWALWEFSDQCDSHIFVWPRRSANQASRFYIVPAEDLRHSLNVPPSWIEAYHGVSDRPCWLGLARVKAFEERWDLLNSGVYQASEGA